VPLEALAADVRFRSLTAHRKRRIAGFQVTPHPLHHPGDAYAYRIQSNGKTLVYASDATYANLSQDVMESYYDFYRGADALVFDAYFALIESYEKSDWGHSSSFIGVDIALCAGVKRLILFHHDPASDDDRLEALLASTQKYLKHVAPDSDCEVILGHEGLELDL
jgi:ribonuclease BN (tRNA processing enzyme)